MIDIQKLNNFMHKFLTEDLFLKNINRNHIVQEAINNEYEILKLSNPWFDISPDSDAVTIPVVGYVKSAKVKRSPKCARMLIEIIPLINVVDDYDGFKKLISVRVNSTIKHLEKQNGFTNQTVTTGSVYLAFERPGSNKEYFRDLGDGTILELRAYSDCVPAYINEEIT